jgi:hypothetical protein
MKIRVDNKYFRNNIYFDLIYGKTYESHFYKKLLSKDYFLARKRWFKLNLRIKGFRIDEQNLNNISGYNWDGFYYSLKGICRYCFKEVDRSDAIITNSYWGKGRRIFICHKVCKKEGEKDEAYECQKIDANCNDCKFFDRKKYWCIKLDCKPPVAVTPNYCSHLDCFVHRKDNDQ